jgi:hypothetical protein
MWLGASRYTHFKVDGRHLLEGGPGQSQGFRLQVTCKGREKADCNHSRSIVTQPMHVVLKNGIKCAKEKRGVVLWQRAALIL